MIETVKKTLKAGFGAALITKETVEHSLREWIEKGKISPEEARQFTDKLVSAGDAGWEDAKVALAGRLEETIASANIASRARIEALEARVASLETRLTAVEQPSV
jgi:polyhydroxyalkanoate synthesis regulator phasin